MTAKLLLEQYMAERHALGFVGKTDRDCIRRFLQDYVEPDDEIERMLDAADHVLPTEQNPL